MIPQQWAPPCNNQCTHKYSALMQIPCLSECEEICYKNPVLKDQQWSAYIDRSPGAASCSEECFHACVAGCGYKFDVPSQKVDQIHPSRPPQLPPKEKPAIPAVKRILPRESSETTDDIPGTSA
ncbi:unnamed protein product [Withania somnifera]